MHQQNSIYQVFVRNYAKEQPFQALTADLHRIKAMGFDYVYLMPIHPISEVNRKGTLGSPYSISDYYGIDEHLGTLSDFQAFLEQAHDLGLKVLLDMVFNHTGGNHYYLAEHPDFYWRDEQGELTYRVGDWSDIVDLDFTNKALHDELIEVLKYWAKLGVDGFRFDVASLIPMEFWLKARGVLDREYSHLLWAAESIDLNFHRYLLKQQIEVENVPALAQVFDAFYDYETWDILQQAFTSETKLKQYAFLSNRQVLMQPQGTILWRFIENHDQDRIASLIDEVETWLYFNILSYGMAFVYQGQEWGEAKRTSLFDLDLIEPRPGQFTGLITQLNRLKKTMYQAPVIGYEMDLINGLWLTEIMTTADTYYLILDPYQNKPESIAIPATKVMDLITNEEIELEAGRFVNPQRPLILKKLA